MALTENTHVIHLTVDSPKYSTDTSDISICTDTHTYSFEQGSTITLEEPTRLRLIDCAESEDTAPVTQVTGVAITRYFTHSILSWVETFSDHDSIHVFRSTTDNYANAVFVGESRAMSLSDSTNPDEAYYYWFVPVSKSGLQGAVFGSEFNDIGGTNNIRSLLGIDALNQSIDALQDFIDTQLPTLIKDYDDDALNSELGLLRLLTEDIGQGFIQLSASVIAQADTGIAQMDESLALIQNDVLSFAQQVSTLSANFETVSSKADSSIDRSNVVLASANEALSQTRTELLAAIDSEGIVRQGEIDVINTARVADNQVSVEARQNLDAKIESEASRLDGAIETQRVIRISDQAAISSRIDNLGTGFATAESNINSRITTELLSVSTALSAAAQRVDQIESQFTDEVNNVLADFDSRTATFTAAETAYAQKIVELSASVIGVGNSVNTLSTNFSNQVNLLIAEDTALSQTIENLTAAVGINASKLVRSIDLHAGQVAKDTGKVIVYYSASEPLDLSEGNLWVDADQNNQLYLRETTWVSIADDLIGRAFLLDQNLSSLLDGKLEVFYQDTQPVGSTGDFWFDTTDTNVIYRYSGTEWEAVFNDVEAAQAIQLAQEALAAADGKIFTHFADSEPTDPGFGDLWFDTDDGNKLYRWDLSTWVVVTDADVAKAILDSSNAQETADGKIVSFYQNEAPTALEASIGDLWIDTNDGNKQYRWTYNDAEELEWIDIQDEKIVEAIEVAGSALTLADSKVVTYYSDAAPVDENGDTLATEGDLWFDTDDGFLYRYTTTEWLRIQDSDIVTAIENAQTAQNTADGKIVTFYQDDAPTGAAVGDLWFDTDDNNKLYVYRNDEWVSGQDGRIAIVEGDITQLNTIELTSTSALVQAHLGLFSTVDGHTTTISETATSVDGLLGAYSLTIDNNGVITGIGITSKNVIGTAPSNAVTIAADNFALAASSSAALWDIEASYVTDDTVYYAGRTYKALTATVGVVPVNSLSDWEDITVTPFEVVLVDETDVIDGVTVVTRPAGVYLRQAFIHKISADQLDADAINASTISITQSNDDYTLTHNGTDYTWSSGSNGVGILWKGSFAAAPTSPELNWAYYNTLDKKSYLYDGTTWGVIAIDGNNADEKYIWIKYADTPTTGMSDDPTGKEYIGVAYNKTTNVESEVYADYSWSFIKGEAGVSPTVVKTGDTVTITDATGATVTITDGSSGTGILWKGTFATAPTSPEVNWAYRNTTENKNYIYNGTEWSVFSVDGTNAPEKYIWIKYANSPTDTLSDSADGKEYIGIAYNQNAVTESTTYADYTWSRIQGRDGEGILWKGNLATAPASPVLNWAYYNTTDKKSYLYNGTSWETLAIDGTNATERYIWIKYADSPTTGMSDSPSNKAYIGLAYNKTTATESTTYGDYTWTLIKGADGTSAYTYIRYSALSDGTSFTTTPSASTEYIGVYSGTAATAPTTKTSYNWTKVKGESGTSNYTYVRYSAEADGTGFVTSPLVTTKYIGIYSGSAETAPTDKTSYNWSLIRGDDGVPSYTYIRYSASADGTGLVALPTALTIYMGVYTGTSSTAPTLKTAYTWAQFRGADGVTPIKGTDYDDGVSQYVHVRYSPNSDGTSHAAVPSIATQYIGIYSGVAASPPTPAGDYTWSKYVGTDGDPGASAYDVWIDAGNTGTEADFLAAIKGNAGQDGLIAFPNDGSAGLFVDSTHLGYYNGLQWTAYFDNTGKMYLNNTADNSALYFNGDDLFVTANLNAKVLNVETANIVGDITSPIAFGGGTYDGVIGIRNLSQDILELIDSKLAAVSGGIVGETETATDTFTWNSIGQKCFIDDFVVQQNPVTITVQSARSWAVSYFGGLPASNLTYQVQRRLGTGGTWSNVGLAKSVTVNVENYAIGEAFYDYDFVHTFNDVPGAGTYDYRVNITGAGVAFDRTFNLTMVVSEQSTDGTQTFGEKLASNTVAGDVGSYIFASEALNQRPARDLGSTIPGSLLRPTSISLDDPQLVNTDFVIDHYIVIPGTDDNAVLTGTWRLMGAYADNTVRNDYPVSLWLRIA